MMILPGCRCLYSINPRFDIAYETADLKASQSKDRKSEFTQKHPDLIENTKVSS